MIKVNTQDMYKIAFLFDGWEETLLWSCLQGYMGEAYADDLEAPRSAKIIVGEFCFLAGFPNEEMVLHVPAAYREEWLIMVPQTESWNHVIEKQWGGEANKTTRYAIKKEGNLFDRKMLQRNVDTLPKEYTLKTVEEYDFKRTAGEPWSASFTSNFKSYEEFKEYGAGCVIYLKNELIAGACSYTYYDRGIEVEIATKEAYRRRGLALITGSALILECLKRGLYPSWDARIPESVRLAQKLGYHFSHEYTAYEMCVAKKKLV